MKDKQPKEVLSEDEVDVDKKQVEQIPPEHYENYLADGEYK